MQLGESMRKPGQSLISLECVAAYVMPGQKRKGLGIDAEQRLWKLGFARFSEPRGWAMECYGGVTTVRRKAHGHQVLS